MIFNYVHSCDLRCGYYKQRGGSPFTMCGQGMFGLWTRVQNSVFECVVTEAQYSLLKGRVRDIIDMSLDSVRFYILSKNENKRVEVIGVETAYKVEEALII